MLITHNFNGKEISKEADKEAGFLITNRKGGFFNLGVSSRYRGLFFRLGDDVIKVLDEIRVKDDIKEIRNDFSSIIRYRNRMSESFFMPFGKDALVYEHKGEGDVELLFDVKKAYDNRVWGRNYKLWKEDDKVIVEFTKTTDDREDNTHGEKEYSVFIVIDHNSSFVDILDEWENQSYYFDKERESYPSDRYAYKCLRLKPGKIIFSFSESKKEAVNICNNIMRHLDKYKALQKEYVKVSIGDIKDERLNIAAKCAMESLDSLLVHYDNDDVNLYAGLPWFFQFWSRDILISLKALMLDKEYDTVKRILMGFLHNIGEDGLLPNRFPSTITKCADAIGWYFKRWADFIEILRKEGELKNYFKRSEIIFIKNKLQDSINKIFGRYTSDCLAINGDQETWMDTKVDGDGRSGARIEIQALRIHMYTFLYRLTDSRIYKDIEEKLLKKTKELFWNGSYLNDGLNDSRIRPNLFIAAYICPELLSREEWVQCFETVLPKLWLEWGGLSTLDKEDINFHSESTGESPVSYHRGDSWFWLNNLAALVLYRLDYERFKPYVDKILEASSEDILFSGFIGCHSEVSSASKQSSQGCLSQAWSNAFFVELAEEFDSSN
ncbi:MAG: hypothetical protein KAK00_01465 [Nanoarchaeota archaeon]|nr:hypothetical protein [Nanoarchaeota archaeon]